MAAPPLILAPEADPAPGTVDAISDGLDRYNSKVWPGADWTPRYVIGRDSDDVVRSGVRFLTPMEWLFVNWLWVAEPYRNLGEGTRLMQAAEAQARSRGCRGAYLDTFSFAAPKFYEKLGYREFGRLADFPPGFDRIWMMKRF